ncbi:MAG: AI-2E family transporter [Patescibacteria group bacterium]
MVSDKFPEKLQVNITTRAVVAAFLVVLVGWLAVQLKAVLLILLAALLLALGLSSLIDFLVRKGIKREVAGIVSVLGLGLVFLALGAFGVSTVVDQTVRFVRRLPFLLNALAQSPSAPGFFRDLSKTLADQVGGLSGNVLKVTWGAFSGVGAVITVLVFTVYILIYLEEIERYFVNLFAEKSRDKVRETIEEIKSRLGAWFAAESVLMLCVGSFTFVGLTLLRMDYAVALSVIAGFLEIVPNFGPIISVFPAALVGFYDSVWMGLAAIALFILVQQVENYFIVPKVMQNAIGFNPLVTMVAILTGGMLLGFVGLLFALPLTLVGSIIVRKVFLED